MVTMVKSSGVAFTKDLENGANYYVINYDDVTGKQILLHLVKVIILIEFYIFIKNSIIKLNLNVLKN